MRKRKTKREKKRIRKKKGRMRGANNIEKWRVRYRDSVCFREP